MCFATEDIGGRQGIAMPLLPGPSDAGPGAAAGPRQPYQGLGVVGGQFATSTFPPFTYNLGCELTGYLAEAD